MNQLDAETGAGMYPETRHMSDIQVVIADNQPLALSGLRYAVADQSDIQVLAECESPKRLMDVVRSESPDVLLVSADLLDEEFDEEFEALERLMLMTEMQDIPVIVLTSRKDPGFMEGALRCGARGVFHREWPVHQIPKAIRKVTSGGFWLEQSLAEQVLQEVLRRRKTRDPEEIKIASITQREREVIELICQGLRNKEIATRLNISEATTSHHLSSIYRKLEVDDRTSLVIYAVKKRLVTLL
jgi:DNA-binding NarL/FixJ family response regulator